jgi:hypothetical protein
MTGIRYTCRIKLTDFIETDFEIDVIDVAKMVSDTTRSSIFLKLWYEKDELTQNQILSFVKRYEPSLEAIGTNIHAGGYENWGMKSWFDIRSAHQKKYRDYRHYFVYERPSDIVVGLIMFKNLVIQSENMTPQKVSLQPYIKKENPKSTDGKYKVTVRTIKKDV